MNIHKATKSYPLPYTSDLVRLAASVKIGIDSGDLTLSVKDGCDAILQGYQDTLKNGGCPFVLAENEQYMEKLEIEAIKAPKEFWRKLTHLSAVHRGIPRDAKRALENSSTSTPPLPSGTPACRTGKSWTTPIRCRCKLGRWSHRAGSKGDASFGLYLAHRSPGRQSIIL